MSIRKTIRNHAHVEAARANAVAADDNEIDPNIASVWFYDSPKKIDGLILNKVNVRIKK